MQVKVKDTNLKLDNITHPSTIFEITNSFFTLDPTQNFVPLNISNVSNIFVATLLNSKFKVNLDSEKNPSFSVSNITVESSIPLFRILNNDKNTPVDLKNINIVDCAPPLFYIFNCSIVNISTLGWENSFKANYTQPGNHYLFSINSSGHIIIGNKINFNSKQINLRKHNKLNLYFFFSGF